MEVTRPGPSATRSTPRSASRSGVFCGPAHPRRPTGAMTATDRLRVPPAAARPDPRRSGCANDDPNAQHTRRDTNASVVLAGMGSRAGPRTWSAVARTGRRLSPLPGWRSGDEHGTGLPSRRWPERVPARHPLLSFRDGGKSSAAVATDVAFRSVAPAGDRQYRVAWNSTTKRR
jgi:hypothetical protein